MSLNKKSVDDINVKGQRVLVRCDFNVPLKNGEIIATGEGYKAKKSCLNGIESIRKNADSEVFEEE